LHIYIYKKIDKPTNVKEKIGNPSAFCLIWKHL